MRTINVIIADVASGNMNANQAAVELGTDSYAAKYYSPKAGEWDTYISIFREWKRLFPPDDRPKPAPFASGPPKMQGQLFEPCERCGREPCYMPLHLCDRCWPNGGSA